MNTSTLTKPSPLLVWLAATRPKTLPAAVAPVAVGTGAAWHAGFWHPWALLAALLGAIAIQIGTNLANDVFDFEKGADTADRLGPVRVTQAGWLSPATVRRGMFVAFGVAVMAGLYLVALGGWPIVVIGLLSIASGIAYTGGPWPLGYNGLGDLFVMIFFGWVATAGTAYVESGQFLTLALAAGFPMGALATAILVVNNLRDIRTDALVGKKTLAVRFGEKFARMEYLGLLAFAYLALPAIWRIEATTPWVLAPLITLPLAVRTLRRFSAANGAALNPLLGETARLMLLFSGLLALGLAQR